MPTLDEELLAQQYGFASAVLNSNSELKKIFQDAVAGPWEADRFTAAVRATQWFQKNSETWRNAQIMKASDPATYSTQVAQVRTRLSMMAAELGANVSQVLDKMAEQAYQFGWDDNQIRQSLSKYVSFTNGQVYGQAGQWVQEMRARALDQGVRLDDRTLQNYAQRIAGGSETLDGFLRRIDETAVSAYPHLSERIRAGETVADIAAPYRQTMSALLEMNPDAVDLWEPTVRSALSSKDKDGKPVLQTLYDFEVNVRKDPRWAKTNNARDSAMATTRKVLSDWGVLR